MKKLILVALMGLLALSPINVTPNSIIDEVKTEKIEGYSYWYVVYVRVNKTTGNSFKSFKVIKLIGGEFKLNETYTHLVPVGSTDEYFIVITFFTKVTRDVYVEYNDF